MKPIVLTLLLGVFSSISVSFASSLAAFPADWKSWTMVNETVNVGRDVKLPEGTPLFIQRTVSTYDWINDGKGAVVHIYVHPDKVAQYQTHGPYFDGPTAIAVYQEPGIMFVTEHYANMPLYGIYDLEGLDISQQHPSFAIEACIACHEQFQDICVNGTCGDRVNAIFE
ncbi:hypothetical protein EK599_22720 [Vibrio sp. T187]|uniref:hypothetical protein n=1 Tax=Vibrio TaxID=662 RepID=UPI0010C99727|nr:MULTISPECIES: hypothetical protein [Vibrio]MBW3698495.1 hypothetical protein [Vibrio sp. T187]